MNKFTLFHNNLRRTAWASVAVLGVLGASNSFAADATTTSTATVIEPIAITKSVDLVFGKFAPGAGGTVTVATDGSRTASGPILSTSGSSPTAAKFDITGDNDATYSITWSGVTELTHTDTVTTMALTRISDLTAAGTTSGEVSSGTLSSTGTQSVYLGGKLTVGASQLAGDYSGNVTITVEYN